MCSTFHFISNNLMNLTLTQNEQKAGDYPHSYRLWILLHCNSEMMSEKQERTQLKINEKNHNGMPQ